MTTSATSASPLRWIIVIGIIAGAFFGSYRLAVAANGRDAAPSPAALGLTPASDASGASGAACACCAGSQGSGETIEGSAAVADGVQRITVDTNNGYNPNVIRLAAGVPAEITFRQASGCLGQVMSADLGFFEDLTAGDKTIRLDGLQPGTYGFSCGMEMVFGEIVVE